MASEIGPNRIAQTFPFATATYQAAGEPGKITLRSGDKDKQESSAIEWLLRQ